MLLFCSHTQNLEPRHACQIKRWLVDYGYADSRLGAPGLQHTEWLDRTCGSNGAHGTNGERLNGPGSDGTTGSDRADGLARWHGCDWQSG